MNVTSTDDEICSTFNDLIANTVPNLNIPAIEHPHWNLQNTDPILDTVNTDDKHPVWENKNGSCIWRSVPEKPILTKLVTSLMI